ncbi:MAG: glycosyl transferase [Bacteroidetes bacterium]|nr:glycosyl transferase [Bacteroidota bacterium]
MLESRIINGVKVNGFNSKEDVINFAFANKGILVAVNAEKIINATDKTRQIINNNISYPDGIGAVMALNHKGYKHATKIPGCELWLDIVKSSYKDKSFYLIGGTEDTIQNTKTKLLEDFEGINIIGYRNGYIKTEEERLKLIEDIELKKPDIVFVAMGSPKQELLMQEMLEKHKAVYQGLGGSFDVYIGKVERAPEWWLKNNLEWAYRLFKQPTRIKRQIPLLKFLFLLKIGKL